MLFSCVSWCLVSFPYGFRVCVLICWDGASCTSTARGRCMCGATLSDLTSAGLVSVFLFHSLMLSLTLSPLASTDRFHNHFSEVAASSAVVTQPLSFTCTYTPPQEYYTTQNPFLKETARDSMSSHNMLQAAFKGSACLFMAQSIPPTRHQTCGCGMKLAKAFCCFSHHSEHFHL